MTNQEILTEAIQKAIDGGWEPRHFDTLKASYKHPEDSEFHDLLGDWHNISPLDVIFNHDFAKALWGEIVGPNAPDMKCRVCKETHGVYWEDQQDLITDEPWKYHLQQMVIADDPIEYLGQNLN